MTADPENVRVAFADQLADFDEKLNATADDVEMLAEIREGIGNLLVSSGDSESEIRRVLQERFDKGSLRKETFQLVKSMLDHYVTEDVATAPTPRRVVSRPMPEIGSSNDEFGATTIIPVDEPSENSADARVQVGSVLRDRFLLQEKIAGGSMGVVYKALDRRLAESGSNDKWVAIKVLSPHLAENGQALRALQQEAAKGRCLVHPNIVRFIDLDREDDLYFLVMEWLEGRTLANILDSKDGAIIDHNVAFKIAGQIGDALDYAHRCGIVHADVKPGNIMIMPNGDAKLFDFGVARVRQEQSQTDFDPGVLGALTPAYSSMQVLTGEEPTATDDVFSLACLLYRLLAGYRVFGPRNAAEASLEGMTPQRLQAVSDRQWRAIKKALSYARVTRFDSIREFTDALDEKGTETVDFERPHRFVEQDNSGGNGKWLLAIVLALTGVGLLAYQFGYLDVLLSRLDSAEVVEGSADVTATPPPPTPEAETILPELTAATASGEQLTDDDVEVEVEDVAAAEEVVVAEEAVVAEVREDTVGPASSLVDFSKLPPATLVIEITESGTSGPPVSIALREDGRAAIVDFARDGDLSRSLTLRLEEVGFSGNRSPWASGQYAYSNSGLIHFPAGQERARITLTTASDPRREADQHSTLRLRDVNFAESEFAVLKVILEDDDQRRFESSLPVNTVAFASSQVSIRETDPAVQVDIIRFNPDRKPLVVGFSINDITATEGSDYFAPGSYSITFAPGQRAARLLIPLVHDEEAEGDEAFVIELTGVPEMFAIDVYHRIVVMIRDDEPQFR